MDEHEIGDLAERMRALTAAIADGTQVDPAAAANLAAATRALAAALRTPRGRRGPAEVPESAVRIAAELRAMTSAQAGEEHLAGLTLAELRQVWAALGHHGQPRTARDAIQRIIHATISGPGTLRRAMEG